MWRIITTEDCIARATTIEQEITSTIGTKMPTVEQKRAGTGRFVGVQNCYGSCVDCGFLVGGERPAPVNGGHLLANEHAGVKMQPLESCLDYACATLRTAISQGGKTKMPQGLRKIPLSCFDIVLSIAVYHYASRTLNQSTQNQDPRRLAYQQALQELEKIRKGERLVEDDDSEEVAQTKTGASVVREHGYNTRWSRGQFNHGIF